MTSDVFANLEAIRHFLAEDIAGQVPSHLRAEVRAAAKVLRDIAREIDALPALLFAECVTMLQLCGAALGDVPHLDAQLEIAAVRRQLDLPPGPLAAQIRLHQELKGAVELILLALIEQFDDAPASSRAVFGRRITDIYRLLAEQADARIHWQSVFPPLPAHPHHEIQDRS